MQLSCDPEQTDFFSYKNIVFKTYQPWYPIFSIWIGLLKFGCLNIFLITFKISFLFWRHIYLTD